MANKIWSRCIVLLGVIFCLGGAFLHGSENSPPNIIVVLADDLGYGDLGCYGNELVHTPHLDRFAEEGLRFTSCYAAAANCSPSRAGLMTGRTPWRIGIHNWIPTLSPMHLKASEVTIATLLRDKAGYSTCHSGKWHLNGNFNLPGQPQPSDHGFDHWFSAQNNALPNHRNPWNFVRNGVPVGPLEGYAGFLVAEEAIRWLRSENDMGGRDLEKPFFMFVCFQEPHEPVASAERFTRLYEQFEDPAERALYGNISQLDAAFGQLMAEVDSLRLRENTLVFFTSDNGPALTGKHPYGSSGPFRTKKGYLYEGGIRVPGILRWPGKTVPGSESDVPICGVDLLPTLCEVAGIETPKDRVLDGASFLPVLKNPENAKLTRNTPLYWHFLRARGQPKVAIRMGDWKLTAGIDSEDLKPAGGITAEDIQLNKSAELAGFQLFNLAEDPGETMNVAEKEPVTFEEMKSAMLQKYHEVREESPVWPVWEWPKYESKRIEWPEYKAMRRPPVYSE